MAALRDSGDVPLTTRIRQIVLDKLPIGAQQQEKYALKNCGAEQPRSLRDESEDASRAAREAVLGPRARPRRSARAAIDLGAGANDPQVSRANDTHSSSHLESIS